MGIFNFFGSMLGYLLWALYLLFRNYGVAIIFFSVIVKLAMFPATVKQQKSMAAQSKMAAKQKELQQKYGKDRQRYQQEVQKLYDREGVNPGAGCLVSLIPMPIMLGIFYSVIYPLSNTLHIAKDSITKATEFIVKIPGMVSIGNYPELTIIRNFDSLEPYIKDMFTAAEMEKMRLFSTGFNFLGLDLLSTPQGSPISTMLWVIPLVSLITMLLQQFYTSKTMAQNQAGQQGCMKWMMYIFPLISVYWAYIMPAAVGFYWVTSSVTSFGQSVLTNKFFSANHVTAMAEAQRALTLEMAEKALKPLPAKTQKEIEEKIMNAQSAQKQGSNKQNKSKGYGKKRNK